MNILFVCTGNVSRSFLAERLLRRELESRGMEGFFVASAGLDTRPGIPGDPVMIEYLREKDIEAGDHEARLINEKDVRWADLILVMETVHLQMIESRWPWAAGKTKLFLEYAVLGPKGDEIIDPFGKTQYHYRLAQAQIEKAVRLLAEKLFSSPKNGLHAQD
ncbi:MAG: low molecular weight protein arginine phosphatase [Deltaproteobacteria bacterium]|nr:low molecular weight protein arginine phosphatase [Deltaproteobacteria bacterium]MBW2129833.1 low molecular weight protein arginine phosphatase [Deltaproteobacteria bacterium]MBW2305011.1 low molecular weight protein arginine phosphatase [Deltaproteobacteria bacterium]